MLLLDDARSRRASGHRGHRFGPREEVVVEEEEVLRLKVETTLLQIMVAQNLKDFATFLMPSIFKLLGNFF